jgi:catechol 2,3-dioxygenase-like lactoylglutathione lyase family enzyme
LESKATRDHNKRRSAAAACQASSELEGNLEGNTEAERHTPMFGRGRLDHFGLQAASIENFDEIRQRLRDRGAADDFVTDFGPVLSMFFRDPDGLECEVCVANPDAVPGVSNPPGTRAARYPAEA